MTNGWMKFGMAAKERREKGVQGVQGVQGQTGDRIGFFNAGSNRGALRVP
jgi:hypothetical protein